MTRVSNQTNNLDPTAVNSRVFVGNLNTYVVSKEDVATVFARYGPVIGISMHKGYAFVQFSDCFDARNAVLGEDGRTIAGQILDVNMVSEPKPHQLTRKRQGSPRHSLDIFADRLPRAQPTSPCPTLIAASPSSGLVLTSPSSKRLRTATPLETALIMHGALNSGASVKGRPMQAMTAVVGSSLFCSDSDILVCGVCKQLFSCLQGLLTHKAQPCRLRFTCRCQDIGGKATYAPSTPQCAQCSAQCDTWWDLVLHAEEAHGVSVYRHADETDPSQRILHSVSASPSPSCTETQHAIGDNDVLSTDDNPQQASDSDISSSAENLGERNNEDKAVPEEGTTCATCNSEQNSETEMDRADSPAQALDVNQDKCVDTKDLLNG